MKALAISNHSKNKAKAALLAVYTVFIHLLAIIGGAWVVVTYLGPF